MITKKNFWAAGALGLLLALAFSVTAFTEPTSLPADNISYPPINVGAETQYRIGKLGIGDGSNLPGESETNANTLFSKGVFGVDQLSVRQNATLVGDVDVSGRSLIAGAMRVGQLIIGSLGSQDTKADLPGYSSTSYKLYFPVGSDTNLGQGVYCTVTSSSCPPGTILWRYDSSNSKSTCKYINPVVNSASIGTCPSSSYPTIALTLTSTSQDTSTCKATRNYSSSASGTTYWEIKGANDTSWSNYGSGSTTNVIVNISSANEVTVYNLRARTVNNSGLSATSTIDVKSVKNSLCTSTSTGGGSGGM